MHVLSFLFKTTIFIGGFAVCVSLNLILNELIQKYRGLPTEEPEEEEGEAKTSEKEIAVENSTLHNQPDAIGPALIG